MYLGGNRRGVPLMMFNRGVHAHSCIKSNQGQDGGKLKDLYRNSKPANSSWIHIFDAFFLKRVTYEFKEANGLLCTPDLRYTQCSPPIACTWSVFRKPWYSHTFSVIRQHQNYKKCMETLTFSKNWPRTSLHSRFKVQFLWTPKLLGSHKKHQKNEFRKN